jgi:hypothetical protein
MNPIKRTWARIVASIKEVFLPDEETPQAGDEE